MLWVASQVVKFVRIILEVVELKLGRSLHIVVSGTNGLWRLVDSIYKVFKEAIVGELITWVGDAGHEVQDQFVALGLDGALWVVIVSRVNIKFGEEVGAPLYSFSL